MITYQKNIEGQLEKSETKEEISTYDLKFLLSQKATLEIELTKVNELILEAQKLGLEVKPDII